MKVTIDQAIQVLCTLVVEDRTEVRTIRNKINSAITTLVITSFAITAFLIDKHVVASVKVYASMIDLLIIVMMAFAFWRLMIDLHWARRALESREQLIKNLGEQEEPLVLNPFPSLEASNKPHILDTDMKWVFGFGILLMLMKISITWNLLP